MNQPTLYPPGTVRALLTSEHVSPRTHEVLTKRLTHQAGPLHFFSANEARTLQRIANRLIPQPDDSGYVVDLVSPIDNRLITNESDGWRYDTMPADGDAFRLGIAGFHESAQALYGRSFDELAEAQQDELIRQLQQGTAPGAVWQKLPSNRFFEELLAELVSIYYSHPLSQEAIGYVGMADKPGWTRIGLNELEEREPGHLTPIPSPFERGTTAH